MATQTTNYKLIKPAQSDYYNVDDFNQNCDKLDSAIKEVSDRANSAINSIPSLRQEIYKTGGSYTFQAPKTTTYIVECIGGGGGCTIASSTAGGYVGGGGSYVRQSVSLAAGQSINVTVGSAGTMHSTSPAAGGASSFGSYATAPGGFANVNITSQNNMPGAGDIRMPGRPMFNDMGSTSSYATGFSGSSIYGTPTTFNLGSNDFASTGQTGAGAGVGGVYLCANGKNQAATPGMVIVTWVA